MAGERRFEVDRTLCQGHNRCAALAPDVFDIDDDGFASVYDDGAIPDDLLPVVDDVINSCPEGAISVKPSGE